MIQVITLTKLKQTQIQKLMVTKAEWRRREKLNRLGLADTYYSI